MRFGISRTAGALLLLLAAATGGVTHAVAILAFPWRSHRDAFARVAALAPIGTKVLLPQSGRQAGALPLSDPAFLAAVCRYDVGAQPFRLSLQPIESGFVTLGFHSRHGLGFYGLTVRAADATLFDLVLTTKGRSPDTSVEGKDRVVSVDAPEPEGFVLIATPVGDSGDLTDARERLAKFQCRSEAPSH